MDKREWHYILPPTHFECRCNKCWNEDDKESKAGFNIAWSEYAGMIWCHDCKVDTLGFGGIFDGPIPLQAAYLLGSHFDRINLREDKIELFNLTKAKISLDCYDELTIEIINNITKKIITGENDDYGESLRYEGRRHFITNNFFERKYLHDVKYARRKYVKNI